MSHSVVVTVPAESHALTTLDAVKLRLGITDNAKDALLSELITQASAMIETYLGRAVGIATYKETWRVPSVARRDSLVLAYSPVTAVSSVIEDTVTLVQDTDFELVPETGIIYRVSENVRFRWLYAVEITYTSGWDPVPADIEAICIDLVAQASLQTTRDPSIQLELTEGVGRVAYFNRGWSSYAFDDAMKTSLAAYTTVCA